MSTAPTLINNAGIVYFSTLEHDTSLDAWGKVMDVNVRGPMALIQAVLPSMIVRQRGTIITVSSNPATQSFPGTSAYAASKAAISKAHEILDLEFRPHGIISFSVLPGGIPDTGIAKGDDKINMKAMAASKDLQAGMQKIESILTDTLDLAADTMVALAADPEARMLSGKFVDATQNLRQAIAKTKKKK